MPRDDHCSDTAPANAIYRYTVRDRAEAPTSSTKENIGCLYNVGDAVWVRPGGSRRCDSRYVSGVITRIISDQTVKVNGMPRHVRDIRRRTEIHSQPTRPVPKADGNVMLQARTSVLTGEPDIIQFVAREEPSASHAVAADINENEAEPASRRSTRRR
uniref:DUF5641 domain-containing protein n=1 Tax=Trichuris muris TaxID=70415 RepID=A0A5S6QB68_TRIMR